MTRFLQINLNHCKSAQQLLLQQAINSDVIIISEQHISLPSWYNDNRGVCAIGLRNGVVPDEVGTPGQGYVWIRLNGIRIYSCYISPNIHITEFETFLSDLERSIRSGDGEIIVAGDFNAKHSDWDPVHNERRGELLSTWLAALGLYVCNRGVAATYERDGSASVVDVTLASASIVPRIQNWHVLDEESYSDHNYIGFTMLQQKPDTNNTIVNGWAWRKIDYDKIHQFLDTQQVTNDPVKLMLIIKEACDECMPKRQFKHDSRKPKFWWTQEIAELRKTALIARRTYQRARRRRRSATNEHAALKEERNKLKLAIRRSQESCWRALCADVDHDPWGTPYRVVMRKIGGQPPVPKLMIPRIVDALFPVHPAPARAEYKEASPLRKFTEDELKIAVHRMPNRKAPGPDGIPNEVVKLMASKSPLMFLNTFNHCMETGYFPLAWKSATLVLLRKGDKPQDQTSSYRPICLLSCVGKLFERLLFNRLEAHLCSTNGLSSHQFGFRRGKSTIDAISEVQKIVRNASIAPLRKRGLCSLVTLDVANAFNTASWDVIDRALVKKNVPGYLVRVVRSYLSNRSLLYADTSRELSSGVPQGSVLGPLLWNVMYDEIFQLDLPHNVSVVGFADDIALVGTDRTTPLLELAMNEALSKVADWLNSIELNLAVQKTEAVMLTSRKGYTRPSFKLGEQTIEVQRSVRYLGVLMDSSLTFIEHAKSAGAKAMRTTNALSRILPNIGGPSPAKRKLLAGVVRSQLLYAAPTWASAVVKREHCIKHLRAAYRRAALRVSMAYRTTSYEAATMLSAMAPIEILATEREKIRNCTNTEERAEVRRQTISDWQSMWDSAPNGRWTHRLLPDIKSWISRKHGNLNHFITQALSGHGCFGDYLYKYKIVGTAKCIVCDYPDDSPEHTIFQCDAWHVRRQRLYTELGESLTPESIGCRMTRDRKSWDLIANFLEFIMVTKLKEERFQQQQILITL